MGKKDYWIVFLIFFPLFSCFSNQEILQARLNIDLPRFVIVDRLATDSKARTFRTGEIDSYVEQIPAGIEELAYTGKDLKRFVSILLAGADSDFSKAKRIHDWMTLRIAYDSNILIRLKTDKDPDGGVDAVSTLKYRRSNCEGLARTYALLCATAGLEARYVVGALNRAVNKSGNLSSHAWNLVRLEGAWYIVDCSANSRFFYVNGSFGTHMPYSMRFDHLFISPEAKILAYYAYDPADCLLSQDISVEDFKNAPKLTIGFAKYGLSLSQETLDMRQVLAIDKSSGGADLFDSYESTASRLELKIYTPADVFLTAGLFDSEGKALSGCGYAYRRGDYFVCEFDFPEADKLYGAKIYARSLADPFAVNEVYSFKASGKMAGVPSRTVEASFVSELLNVRIHRVERGEAVLRIYYSHPREIAVISFMRDSSDSYLRAKKLEFEYGSGFEYEIGAGDGLKIYLSGRLLDVGWTRGNQRIFVIDPLKIEEGSL
ncbi:MAG: hypothetical protein JXR63_05690 [Spirochaetales bacterium]|nr:hypothetical protein [Spirochaetales bacterium]